MTRCTGRVIHEERVGAHRVYVMRDTHWDEYRAELWLDGVHYEPADYHTEDRRDAIGTARLMASQACYVAVYARRAPD